MTRREEIEHQAMNSYPDCPERGFGTGDYEYPEFHDDEREAFAEGAKWADKTMIDKACSILEDMTEGRLGKRFISEFKNKLEYGVLERH